MTDTPDALEARIAELRVAVRRAVVQGDRTGARQLRAALRQAEKDWDAAVLGEPLDEIAPPVSLVPVREHVHRALTLLSVPSAPKVVLAVHETFYSGELVPARLTSLRRDEERSFRAAPYTRPYYICAALTTDLLAPARGLMALSTWPLEQRMVGPLTQRAHLLTSVIRLGHHVVAMDEIRPDARKTLWRLAVSIPGVVGFPDDIDPKVVIGAAERELAVHREADNAEREAAAARAVRQLSDPASQLFGARLGMAGKRGLETG
ncbi:hypothetical protein [Nocardia jejuensis]|uniref:hypothetical protein n=1 Tax=Nocardia jejuensis TaxID=328049 RepID=UPI00083454BA|nr:hypothetical protein [Nocardia jejuensis]